MLAGFNDSTAMMVDSNYPYFSNYPICDIRLQYTHIDTHIVGGKTREGEAYLVMAYVVAVKLTEYETNRNTVLHDGIRKEGRKGKHGRKERKKEGKIRMEGREEGRKEKRNKMKEGRKNTNEGRKERRRT